MTSPTLSLSNGLRVANFSSPHPFTFVDGSVLPACSPERARSLMLKAVEVESPGPVEGVTDISLTFELSPEVTAAIEEAQQLPVDVVLIPLPVMTAIKAAGLPVGKCRTIRVADRVTKAIHIDRFCK